MSKPTPSRPSPSAFPILMRLPDLRVVKGSRDVPAVTALGVTALAEAALPEQRQLEEARGLELESPPVGLPAAPAPVEVSQVIEPPVNEVANDVAVALPTTDASSVNATPDTTGVAEAAAVFAEPSPTEPSADLHEKTEPTAAAASHIEAESVGAAEHLVTADVTNASPSSASEPVTPAAARRQRALERQRRQIGEPQRPRTWWTTHLPVIGVCFVVALLLTIYVGRRNRAREMAENQTPIAIPELEIDVGDHRSGPSTPSFSEPEPLPVDDSKLTTKSPPLLSAKPKISLPEESIPSEMPFEEKARATQPPIGNRGEIVNEFVSTGAAESAPATAELSAAGSQDYPSTERAVYRPGGRAPREARVPNYPQTSTPHLR